MEKSTDAFRTISEVADELNLPQHVLRFWETRFSNIKPMKRAGGRRYYRPDDFELLQGIRHLLYDQGYTIKGVQKLLKQNGNKYVIAIGAGDTATAEAILATKQTDLEADKANSDPNPDSDRMLGLAKVPIARRFLSGSGAVAENTDESDDAGNPKALSKDDRALLQETLYDLLECKRLLDQTR